MSFKIFPRGLMETQGGSRICYAHGSLESTDGLGSGPSNQVALSHRYPQEHSKYRIHTGLLQSFPKTCYLTQKEHIA